MIHTSRFAAAALVATAVLGATAACTGSSAGSGSASSTSGSVATGVTGSGSPSPSGAGATTPSGSGSATAPVPSAGAEGLASCTGLEIQVAVKGAGAAMNHSGDVLIFTNEGGSACTLEGYPGVAVVKGSATLLNATRSLSGYMFDAGLQLSSAPLVALAPGKSASALVEWVGNAGEACYANGSGALEVTPPNTRNTSSFGTLTLGDDGICADFEVHPVVSGVLPYAAG